MLNVAQFSLQLSHTGQLYFCVSGYSDRMFVFLFVAEYLLLVLYILSTWNLMNSLYLSWGRNGTSGHKHGSESESEFNPKCDKNKFNVYICKQKYAHGNCIRLGFWRITHVEYYIVS